MNIRTLTEGIADLNLLPQYDNVHAYGISTKIKNNTDTGQVCIRFLTTKKLAIEKLDSSQLIPSIINVNGIDIVTDVVQAKQFELLRSILSEDTNSQPVNDTVLSKLEHTVVVNEAGIPEKNTGISIPVYNRLYSDVYSDPLSSHMARTRPLKGGISSHSSGRNRGSVVDGTLGIIVRDATDNSIVTLSNNHVYSQEQFMGWDGLKGSYISTIGLSARQPSSLNPYSSQWPKWDEYPGSETGAAADLIGINKRCVPWKAVGFNNIDASISTIDDYTMLNSSSTNIVGFTNAGPQVFATTQEIDSLMDPTSPNWLSPIFRSGRTYGALGYPGSIHTINKDITATYLTTNVKKLPITVDSIQYVTNTRNSSNFQSGYYFPHPTSNMVIAVTGNDYYHVGYNKISDSIYNRTRMLSSFFNYDTVYFVPSSCDGNKFNKIGTFDFFTIINGIGNRGHAGSIGLSGGRLVYIGKMWSDFWYLNNQYMPLSANVSGNYIEFPYQIPGGYASGIKAIINDGISMFALVGTNLYSLGMNVLYSSIGFGEIYQFTGYPYFGFESPTGTAGWRKVPGTWDDIYPLNYGIVALSGQELFCTAGNSDKYIPVFTNSFNLTANNLNLGKFSKVFMSDSLIGTNICLSADNKTLFEISLDSTTRTFNKRQLNGVWNTTVDIPTSTHAWVTNIPMIYNGNLYTMGTQVNKANTASGTSNWSGHYYKPTTSFLQSSFNGESDQFNIVPNINISKIHGTTSSYWSGYDEGLQGESLIFLSGGNWYSTGTNTDNVLGGGYYITKDHIVVSGLGYNCELGGVLADSIYISDCFTIKSKENSFIVGGSGDSGSAVFALLSSGIPTLSAWKCIGLIYAGANIVTNSSEMIGCRIDNIVNELKVKAWDGTIPTVYPKIQNTTHLSISPYLSTVSLSGRQFFNIGLDSYQ